MRKTPLFVLTLSGLTALPTNILRVPLCREVEDLGGFCRDAFTDLATVHDQDDNDRLLRVLQGLGTDTWLGLYDDRTRWKWTLGNADFSNDTDFSEWKSSEPSHKNSQQNCTVKNKEGLWYDSVCWKKHPAVCYYGQGPPMYIFMKTQMTWNQAEKYCRSIFTALVSVRNMSENDQISSLLTEDSRIGPQKSLG